MKVSYLEWFIMLAVSAVMMALSWFRLMPLDMTEVLGFATGGICVWLTVREHIWNWPIGLANNIFFFVLFFYTRLYADMALQVVYFGLGVYGWWNWLYGGTQHQELTVSRTTRMEWLALLLAIPVGTWGLRELLIWVNGSAPFWDSLTTALSLGAQYLLCRKRIENWFLWIAADVIYIPLYMVKALPLTGILYGVFLVMCILGFRQWMVTLKTISPSPRPA